MALFPKIWDNFLYVDNFNRWKMFDTKIIKIEDDLKFCEMMLQKVSRTFAINIGFLKGDIYKTVLCGYLFCRIIDTIEDSNHIQPEKKVEALTLWQEFFPFKSNFHLKLKHFKSYLNYEPENYDDLLVLNSERVFKCFQEVDENMIERVINPINTMARGMAEFQSKISLDKTFYQISDVDELEKYCYFVAGTVGEMLKSLFVYEIKNISKRNEEILEKNKISFGLGLQLTNILKDVKVDLTRDWIYFPKSLMDEQSLNVKTFFNVENKDKSKLVIEKLINLAVIHLDKAFEYCMALPKNYSVRLFHLLPLHFAIYTLADAKKQLNYLPDWNVKINRKIVTKLILLTKVTFFSNGIQNSIYQKARKKLL